MAYNSKPLWELVCWQKENESATDIETCTRMLEIWAESGKDLYKLDELVDSIRDAHNHIFKLEDAAEENPPICCGVGAVGDCDKPCDKKYIGNKKSEMWGETDEFAKHPYHWNQCGDCFKKESGEDESESEEEE